MPSILKDMTKLHYQIVAALLPACLEVTARMREKWKVAEQPSVSKNIPETEEDKKILATMKLYLNSSLARNYIDLHYKLFMIDMLAIATGKRYLKLAGDQFRQKQEEPQGTKIIYDPLTIVVSTKKESNLEIGKAFMVVHGINKKVLKCSPDGKLVSNTFYADNILEDPDSWNLRIATDEEVEQCLESLGALELKYILSDVIFAPHLTKLFDDTVVEEEIIEEGKEGDE